MTNLKFLILLVLVLIGIIVPLSIIQVHVYNYPEDSLNPAHFNVRVFTYYRYGFPSSNIENIGQNHKNDSVEAGYTNIPSIYSTTVYENGTSSPTFLDYIDSDYSVINFTIGEWYIPRYYTAPLIIAWLPGIGWQFHEDFNTVFVGITYVVHNVFNSTDGKIYRNFEEVQK